MSAWWGFFWLFVLLIGNAFFVAAEFAVISARRSQIEPRAEAGSKRAKTALYAMEHATLMLATSQLGITVCSLIILNVSEPAIHSLLEKPLEALGLSVATVSITAFITTLVLVSALHVVFGEMMPKNAAFSLPDKAVLLLATPLVLISKIFSPVISLLNGIANLALRLVGVEPRSETTSTYTLEEVAHIVSHSQLEGVLEDTTGTLTAAFEFTTKKAKDLAVPFEKLIVVRSNATVSDIENAVSKNGFSRYLVTDSSGDIEGYVHIKDLLFVSDERFESTLPTGRVRALLEVSHDTDLEDALHKMQETGIHLAIVLNSENKQTGVLFLEDIIEELVGEVHDATTRPRFQ